MSSTNKTDNLHLNNWIGSDVPKMEDFNLDNSIIDRAFSQHTSSGDIHTSADEKEAWNSPYYVSSYFGNGEKNRNIQLNCGFTPKWGIVFAADGFAKLNDYANKASYNYFGIASPSGSTAGISLNGNVLSVMQSTLAVFGSEYRSFNENGISYVYIMFR